MKTQSTSQNTILVFSFVLTLLTIAPAQAQQWTNSPIYSLDVNGGVNGFRIKGATTSANDAIATFENSSAIKMIVRGDGNVGIGTVNPTSAAGYTALSLSNSTGALVDYMTNNVLKARLQSDGTTFYFNNLANGPIQINPVRPNLGC